MSTVRELFETNTLGVMAMTQAVLPQFPRATVRCGGQRDVERNARADAAGGRVHSEQDGDRRIYRIARAPTRGVRRAGQTGGARLRPDDPLYE